MNTIELNGEHIPVVYYHKKTKHSYVRIKPPGVLHVTVGRYQTKKMMNHYIVSNQSSLLKRVHHHQQKEEYTLFGQVLTHVLEERNTVFYDERHKTLYLPSDNPKKHLKQFEKKQFLQYINQQLSLFPFQNLINIKDLTISTRYTTTVHGSCNARKRRINLNLYLVRKDKALINYVLMHELAHLNVQNHGQQFYQLLQTICPNHKELRKALRR